MSGISTEIWQGLSVLGNVILTLLLLFAGLGYLTHRIQDKAAWKRWVELNSFLRSFLTQEMVNDRLCQLAAAYNAAAQQQARVLQNPEDDAAIGEASLRVSEAKKAFWKAQNDARDNGYKVEPSFKAYLPAGPRSVA